MALFEVKIMRNVSLFCIMKKFSPLVPCLSIKCISVYFQYRIVMTDFITLLFQNLHQNGKMCAFAVLVNKSSLGFVSSLRSICLWVLRAQRWYMGTDSNSLPSRSIVQMCTGIRSGTLAPIFQFFSFPKFLTLRLLNFVFCSFSYCITLMHLEANLGI